MLEIREIEAVLTLFRLGHFGQSAADIGVSQPRMSQLIRLAEQKIGGELFVRTSRHVTPTLLGEQLHEALEPAWKQLQFAVTQAQQQAKGITGELVLGFMGSAANELTALILEQFQRLHPGCSVKLRETQFSDPLGPLQRGEVEALLTRLPVRENDLTVGPILIREAFMLAVSVQHRWAKSASISLNDLATETLFSMEGNAPAYWWDHHVPRQTPSGLSIARGESVASFQSLLTLVAANKGVAPVAASVSRYYSRPDIAFVPLTDAPANEVALVWRTGEVSAQLKGLIAAIRFVQRSGK